MRTVSTLVMMGALSAAAAQWSACKDAETVPTCELGHEIIGPLQPLAEPAEGSCDSCPYAVQEVTLPCGSYMVVHARGWVGFGGLGRFFGRHPIERWVEFENSLAMAASTCEQKGERCAIVRSPIDVRLWPPVGSTPPLEALRTFVRFYGEEECGMPVGYLGPEETYADRLMCAWLISGGNVLSAMHAKGRILTSPDLWSTNVELRGDRRRSDRMESRSDLYTSAVNSGFCVCTVDNVDFLWSLRAPFYSSVYAAEMDAVPGP